jgi:hypothetical protein
MARLVPDDAAYARWLRVVQDRDREPGAIERGISFWISGVLVFFAFVTLVSLLSSHII